MMRIRVRARGPLVIEADAVELLGADGQVLSCPPGSLRLCRCGASRAKPFCDGAHNRIGFDAPPPEPDPETE